MRQRLNLINKKEDPTRKIVPVLDFCLPKTDFVIVIMGEALLNYPSTLGSEAKPRGKLLIHHSVVPLLPQEKA